MGPTVSVVIPSYGRTPLLVSALRSVLAQGGDLEVIVVAAPGTGGAAARLVRSWSDARVRVVRQETPDGAAGARNTGAEQAAGRVIAFLDETDVWFRHKLSSQLAALDSSGRCWSFGGGLLFSAGPIAEALLPAPTADEVVARLPYANAVPGGGSNVIVTRDGLEAVGGFDPSVPHLEDWDLWIRLAQHDRPAVVDATVVACRQEGWMDHERLEELLTSARVMDARYRGLRTSEPLDWPDLHRWLCHDALRLGQRSLALRLAFGSVRHRHEGGVDLALRSLLPVRRRAPVSSPEEVSGLLARRFPPRIVPWPPGSESELRSLLAPGEDVR